VVAAIVPVALAVLALAAPGAAERQPRQEGPATASAAASPLPDPEAFFAKARERLASNERRQGQFRYTERSTELDFNVFGRMGSGARQTFQVFPSPVRRMTYKRLIERDGTPVPPAQIAQQDRAYLARLDEYRRTLAREGASEREARLAREAERAARERAQVDEAVRIFTFRIERRETLHGHPAIVVSFTPKPGMRPSSREARVAYAFAGTAWVHEHEYELMKLEAEAKDNVSFGWGMIARLNAGMKVLVTRMRLPDGTWVPERSHFVGEGRALMLRKVTIDDLREYSDYTPWEPEQIRTALAQ
jgi:hypothetical protein